MVLLVCWPIFAFGAESIGSAGNGCIAGAEALPLDGTGYQVVRISRQRYFGHPVLLRVIRSLGQEAEARGWGALLVGDLSLARGGPMPYGHGSHQTGLDADILFSLAPKPLAVDERENPPEAEVVAPGGKEVDPLRWNSNMAALLEAAARFPDVDRIFVHPAIKRELCASVHGDRRWLRKIRPWWGHTEHFHLRLACPDGSPACTPQGALPPGDGCGSELSWWFGPEALPLPQPVAKPPLPARCVKLLAN